MQRAFGVVVAILAAFAAWIIRPRDRPRHPSAPGSPSPSAGVAGPDAELPRLRASLGRWQLALPIILTFAGTAGVVGGLAVRPPSLVLNGREDPQGAVEVYVSDPNVEVGLQVQIFDWAVWARFDPIPPSPADEGLAVRMIFFISGDESKQVNWAVVLSGSARYQPPLPYENPAFPLPSPPVLPEDFTSATMRLAGDVQIIEGIALVGPGAITERPADWDGQVVGPFLYHSGSWPDYGSKTLVRLPAFRSGYFEPAESLFPAKQEMFAPKVFEPHVYFGSGSIPEFVRVEYANPPLRGSTLSWEPNELTDGATVLLVDIPKAEAESFRSEASLAMFGFAAGALLSALAAWLALAFRIRSTAL